MKQQSLFDGDNRCGVDRTVVPQDVVGSAAILSSTQKKFNRLSADLEATRQELARRNGNLLPTACAHAEIVPMRARLRQARIAMVELLDQTMQGGWLTRVSSTCRTSKSPAPTACSGVTGPAVTCVARDWRLPAGRGYSAMCAKGLR
jgi:hypothetical protein